MSRAALATKCADAFGDRGNLVPILPSQRRQDCSLPPIVDRPSATRHLPQTSVTSARDCSVDKVRYRIEYGCHGHGGTNQHCNRICRRATIIRPTRSPKITARAPQASPW